MTDWYNDPLKQQEETPAAENPAQEQQTPPAQAVPPVQQTPPVRQATPVQQTPPVRQAPPAAQQYGAPRSPYPQNAPYGVPRQVSYAPPKPPKKKHGTTVAIVLLSVLCCFSLIFSCISGVAAFWPKDMFSGDVDIVLPGDVPEEEDKAPADDETDPPEFEVNENSPTLEITDIDAVDDGGLATSDIVARNLDATVVLTMYTKNNNFFYGYYGEESDGLTEAGGASGIIMTDDGYIITNSHCVYDEEMGVEYDRIDVTLYDGRVFEDADIIGYDPTTDLAVIKIDANNLTAAEFGDSSALALGDRVVTLGNSGGLQWSVSQGVLSGQARDVYEDTGYAIKCLQVDAVINPGSSGGPLINAYGQVVGVNSAKIVLTGYEGLGFSIPINEAKTVIDDLVKYGYVTGRVSLGIMGRTVTSIGYEGFMIDSINSDSAFKGTKAQVGDIITHVNGKRVMDYAEMRAELTSYEVGQTITLTLLRLDRQTRTTEEITVNVKLKESR